MAEPLPKWAGRRPATTVLGDARISAPSPLDRDPAWRRGQKPPSQMKNAVRVTVEEAALLQGFRADYPWQGSRTQCFLQIGNAVCPPIARTVIAALANQSRDRMAGPTATGDGANQDAPLAAPHAALPDAPLAARVAGLTPGISHHKRPSALASLRTSPRHQQGNP